MPVLESNRMLSAILGSSIGIIAMILILIVSGQGMLNGDVVGGLVYLFFILFFPMVFIAYLSNRILSWMFDKFNIDKFSGKLRFTFLITLVLSICYVLITALFFGELFLVVKETGPFLFLGIITILLDTFFFHRWMEKKRLTNEPLDQNIEL